MALDYSSLLRQAQDLGKKIEKKEASLEARVLEGTAGQGLVTVSANANLRLVRVRINPTLRAAPIEEIEDLVTVAANAALDRARELRRAELGKLTGGVSVPGLL